MGVDNDLEPVGALAERLPGSARPTAGAKPRRRIWGRRQNWLQLAADSHVSPHLLMWRAWKSLRR